METYPFNNKIKIVKKALANEFTYERPFPTDEKMV
jgi:hypothetical protein